MQLHELENALRYRKAIKRKGRGMGSGRGGRAGRGTKGDGSRCGYKRRWGKEGGQATLFRKLPTRGFTRGRHLRRLDIISLAQIDSLFNNDEVVNIESLYERGFLKGASWGVKVLSDGELSKKVSIELTEFSGSAVQKLEAAGISFKQV